MSGVNLHIIVGNLGRDPEVRTTQNGSKVANLSVATSERWKDKDTGEQRERSEWHRVVIFGNLAGIAEQYLRKGSRVYLQGKVQTRKWQDNSGNDRYSTETVLQGPDAKLTMLDGKGDGGSQGGWDAPPAGGDMDDEVPF